MAGRGGGGGGAAKKKDVKKASFYVWFLGAKESHGLRGEEATRPALRFLLDQEKQGEPSKVTLQVSNKGMKIVQNVVTRSSRGGGRPETLKHFIPRDAITWVAQEEPPDADLVSCILLLYNPATRCPVHVHAYRCDSVDTAALLCRSLELLVERPEQQRRLSSLENTLGAKVGGGGGRGETERRNQGQQPGSDGRSTRGDSESSGSERDFPPTQHLDERTTHLYASLAAELRQKLGNRERLPLLLPPRDYDTVHRSKGKLDDIDGRRCKQVSVVGSNGVFSRRLHSSDSQGALGTEGSSGRSSGIGSDEAPSSPPRPRPSHRSLDHESNSEDEWEAQRQLHTRATHALLNWRPRDNDPPLHAHHPQRNRYRESREPHSSDWPSVAPRVLPRIQPRSPSSSKTNVPSYQELPEDKRYPGLDRDSARAPVEPVDPPVRASRRQSLHSHDKADEHRASRYSYAEPQDYRFVYPGRRRVSMTTHDY